MSELRKVQSPKTPFANGEGEARGVAEAAVLRSKDDGVRGGGQWTTDDGRQRTEGGGQRTEDGAAAKVDSQHSTPALSQSNGLNSQLTTSAAPSGLVRGAGRPAEVVAFEEAVVSYFVEGAEVLGVPKSVAAIYGICFASPEPLSFSEINGRLEISSGSISQGLRVLREVGALKLAQHSEKLKSRNSETLTSESQESQNLGISAPRDEISESQAFSVSAFQGSSRTARYTPDLELRNLVLHWIETRLQSHLKSGQARMQTIMASVPAAPNAEALRERLTHLQNWQNKAKALVPVMKAFLKIA